ncbi:hypothetical protein INT44_004891 [Umbelopsis vinacea]|uniref:Tyrosine specific protein phosphatases domain-containing protein n=1 Tax=Umbelopsis vinacea TaxID=44442 RepID=A0A8H7Q8Q1_9FUNG|nr:hypothetical protein INT44_004891 [Umbelopsis vinacea]
MENTREQSTAADEDVAVNYRDVGWSVDQSYRQLKKDGQRIQEKRLYRSGELNDREPTELCKFLDRHNIKTVIKLSSDLNFRTIKESTPPEIPKYTTLVEIQVGGGRFKRDGVFRPASNETKIEAAKDAVQGHLKKITQRFSQVLNHKGLSGMYIDYAETSAKGIQDILGILSDPERLPALIHCEQGKDRTGVIIAMILSACGVDRQVIVDDYSKSRRGLVVEYEDVKDEMNDLGLDDEFAKTRPEAIENMFAHLEEIHGSVATFLESKCDVKPDVFSKLYANLAT